MVIDTVRAPPRCPPRRASGILGRHCAASRSSASSAGTRVAGSRSLPPTDRAGLPLRRARRWPRGDPDEAVTFSWPSTGSSASATVNPHEPDTPVSGPFRRRALRSLEEPCDARSQLSPFERTGPELSRERTRRLTNRPLRCRRARTAACHKKCLTTQMLRSSRPGPSAGTFGSVDGQSRTSPASALQRTEPPCRSTPPLNQSNFPVLALRQR
jgi:hypothetical protein